MADSLRPSSITSSVNSDYSIREPEFTLEISEQTDAHEQDLTCLNCHRKFNIPGVAISKKLICAFCYRGVCGNCLSYEYYHQKSKRIEKMCAICHHNLAVRSEKYNQEVQLYRLERAELWKEMKLAKEQKSVYSKERQIAADELKTLKETLFLTIQSKNEQLKMLKDDNIELESRVNKLSTSLNSSNSKISELKEALFKSKKDLELFKKTKGQESDEKETLKAEISAMAQRISLLKGNFKDITEEETFKRIDALKNEIAEIEKKLLLESQKISDLDEMFSEVNRLIGKNELKIEEEYTRISERQISCVDFTVSEEEIIKDLRQQLKDLNDLVRITEKRKEVSRVSIQDVNIRKQGTNSYSVSSELQPSITYTSVYSIEENNVQDHQRRCVNCMIA